MTFRESGLLVLYPLYRVGMLVSRHIIESKAFIYLLTFLHWLFGPISISEENSSQP